MKRKVLSIHCFFEEIKELQELKKFLSNSKELAMQITASILTNEYGISKLESGVAISSITITPENPSTANIFIKNSIDTTVLPYIKKSSSFLFIGPENKC